MSAIEAATNPAGAANARKGQPACSTRQAADSGQEDGEGEGCRADRHRSRAVDRSGRPDAWRGSIERAAGAGLGRTGCEEDPGAGTRQPGHGTPKSETGNGKRARRLYRRRPPRSPGRRHGSRSKGPAGQGARRKPRHQSRPAAPVPSAASAVHLSLLQAPCCSPSWPSPLPAR